MDRLGIIILAAGASTRLGQPKQLLSYLGKPLIRHITEVAIASDCEPIVVVLGAYANRIAPSLTSLNVTITLNERWSTGMASSIQCGLRKMQAIAPNLNGVILMLCDQPFVSTPLIHQLVTGYQTTHSLIVACEYSGIVGVPALFDQRLFPQLAILKGDKGARQILHNNDSNLLRIPFAKGIIDLDTPQNVNQFLKDT